MFCQGTGSSTYPSYSVGLSIDQVLSSQGSCSSGTSSWWPNKQTQDCEGREGTGKVSVLVINNKHILALGKDDKMDQVRISQGFLETCMKVDRKIQHGTHPTAPQHRPGAGKHPGIYRKQEMISNSGDRGNKIGEGRVWGSPVGGADQGLCVSTWALLAGCRYILECWPMVRGDLKWAGTTAGIPGESRGTERVA